MRLWDIDRRALVASVVVDVDARSAAFSPDGNRIAIGLASCATLVLKAKDLTTVSLISLFFLITHALLISSHFVVPLTYFP